MNKIEFLQDLGFAIKVARLRQKISQERLAELSDCSMSYIGFVERGEKSISLYNFLKIANVLNLDLGKFLGDYKF
ncbi:MAG TPA: helix-turn-helix transcriptional regulator [Candidatus Stercorousia faecigallinarum]|nr:helix-turn-helix transcriptional regulator [Candidatus Stercorousia faecigallinarum]